MGSKSSMICDLNHQNDMCNCISKSNKECQQQVVILKLKVFAISDASSLFSFSWWTWCLKLARVKTERIEWKSLLCLQSIGGCVMCVGNVEWSILLKYKNILILIIEYTSKYVTPQNLVILLYSNSVSVIYDRLDFMTGNSAKLIQISVSHQPK